MRIVLTEAVMSRQLFSFGPTGERGFTKPPLSVGETRYLARLAAAPSPT